MKFTESRITGAFFLDPEPHQDERGLFARTFCQQTFAARGLASIFPQCNTSFNPKAGTLRGLHYQAEPYGEAKLVRATRGRVFDVAVDLRPGSPSYLLWDAVELDWNKRNGFFIPSGCAHGFLTLEDDCEVFYQMSTFYLPAAARGARWDDPAFGIEWPTDPSLIGEKDAAYAAYVKEMP